MTVGASGDSAVEGTDYAMVSDLTLTIDAGETTADATFSLDPTNNDSVDGAKTITVDGSTSGLAVRSADLTLNDDDVASTQVTLTLDPREVSERAGSRTVRVTGTLDGMDAHDGDGRDGDGRIGGRHRAGGHGLCGRPGTGADDRGEPDRRGR